MTREIPILFNGEMVRAILDGRKTNTMRPVKHVPALGQPDVWCPDVGTPFFARAAGPVERFCPIGSPGDLLYVRETWQEWERGEDRGYWYRADDGGNDHPWRPSIHMPKRAARIWLRVEDVKVMRTKDVPEETAKREGVDRYNLTHKNGLAVLWNSIYGHDLDMRFNRGPWVWSVSFSVVSTTGKPS